jgi:hypothetical protein
MRAKRLFAISEIVPQFRGDDGVDGEAGALIGELEFKKQ